MTKTRKGAKRPKIETVATTDPDHALAMKALEDAKGVRLSEAVVEAALRMEAERQSASKVYEIGLGMKRAAREHGFGTRESSSPIIDASTRVWFADDMPSDLATRLAARLKTEGVSSTLSDEQVARLIDDEMRNFILGGWTYSGASFGGALAKHYRVKRVSRHEPVSPEVIQEALAKLEETMRDRQNALDEKKGK